MIDWQLFKDLPPALCEADSSGYTSFFSPDSRGIFHHGSLHLTHHSMAFRSLMY